MTTLKVPVRPEPDASLRPVPWRRIAWVTWRQHRAALTGAAVFLGAVAAYLWLSGLQMHHAYATSCHPASSLACTINFTSKYASTVNVIRGALQVVPALIGAFTGAPLLAREMETGTFRYAWTQGFGRWRWTVGKLVILAVAVAVAAELFSLLFSWYLSPFAASGYSIPFSTDIFDLREVAFVGWSVVAFAIGALAGMLIRRTVPAIAATLAIYAGLAAATALWLRQHYMAPLLTSKLNLPPSAWAVSVWFTKDGKFAFARGPKLVNAVQSLCSSGRPGPPSPNTSTFVLSPGQCLVQHGYQQWTSYQPASRFWTFQWIEGGWLIALSVVLIAVTIWLVRRRAA